MALISANSAIAQDALSIRDITEGTLSAETLGPVTPLDDGESYATLSEDGRRILRHSFRTGETIGVLFDAGNTVGQAVDRIDGYSMSPDGTRILVQANTRKIYRRSFTADHYVYSIADKRMDRLSDEGGERSPVWSPDGRNIAFVRDNDIYLCRLMYDNAEVRITKDGKANEIINGVPDWVNEEEFGFSTAMTFTSDGGMLCWIRYDESNVSTYTLDQFNGTEPGGSAYPGSYTYKYPKAGQENSTVSVHSYDLQARQTRKMELGLDPDGYIPRIIATDDPQTIIVYTMNRLQDQLNIYSVNPRSTVAKLLVRESASKYVKEEAMDAIKVTSSHILLPSDRSGYMQLYLYSLANGQLQRRVTDTEYDVTDVYGYDEATGNTYFQAAGNGPMDRQVYVTTKAGKTTCLTTRAGWNSATFSKGMKYFILTWSDRDTPYEYATCNNAGKRLATLVDNKALAEKLQGCGISKREFFKVRTSDGAELNGVMIKPRDFDEGKRYPVVMWQYGGPGSQQVIDSWGMGSVMQGCLFDEYLAQQGCIVACVDGRGTGGRGSEFEKCTYMRLGQLESRDQAEAALYLGTLPYVDRDNIGIWGWSYGGFNCLMSMSEGRGAFKAGVAVAPPTDWRFYDTIYTERYMRTPKENPSGYDDNPITRAGNLEGRLLICQGLADDNVHPQNVFEYTEALVQADKDFNMNVFTNRNHSIVGGNARNHLLRQISNFLLDSLK